MPGRELNVVEPYADSDGNIVTKERRRAEGGLMNGSALATIRRDFMRACIAALIAMAIPSASVIWMIAQMENRVSYLETVAGAGISKTEIELREQLSAAERDKIQLKLDSIYRRLEGIENKMPALVLGVTGGLEGIGHGSRK